MLYQLPDGRTIEISLSDYLELSDEELQSLVGYDIGKVINNPYYGSVINKLGGKNDSDEKMSSEKELPEVTSEEKLKDQDYSTDNE